MRSRLPMLLVGLLLQFVPQLPVGGRTLKDASQQGSQIETGSTREDWHMAAVEYLLACGRRRLQVLSG